MPASAIILNQNGMRVAVVENGVRPSAQVCDHNGQIEANDRMTAHLPVHISAKNND
jgi:flavin-dependent dehydrogenase